MLDDASADTLQRFSGWFPLVDASGNPTGLEVADFVPRAGYRNDSASNDNSCESGLSPHIQQVSSWTSCC